MTEVVLKKRVLEQYLPSSSARRLVVLTGARQTGKTTLSKTRYSDLRYINLDSPENRETLKNTSTASWGSTVGSAILDEAQKEPIVFEKVKYAFDEGKIAFTILTGSSQIMLLKKIRESLAGRAFFYEMWPLTQYEINLPQGGEEIPQPLFCHLFASNDRLSILSDIPAMLLEEEDVRFRQAEEYILTWGGMPALLPLSDTDRWKWLKDYGYTYLERDLSDLVRLDDLSPFRKFQKLSALRSGMLLNYSELARDTGISVDTAKRYLEYLRISYQTVLLQPYHKNLTSSVVKTPKLYWTDIGVLRQLTGFRREVTGELYETMVVSELIKGLKSSQMDAEIYFYRTRSGMEMDLLIQTQAGFIGMEIKSRQKVVPQDLRVMKEIAAKLGSRWVGGMVVYRGNEIRCMGEPNIWAVPSRRLFQSSFR